MDCHPADTNGVLTLPSGREHPHSPGDERRYPARMSPHDSSPPGLASDLQRYLQEGRTSLLSALDGLSDYDVRRPMVPSGTNLLGLVKHLVGIELSYLGDSVGRPSDIRLPWVENGYDLGRRRHVGHPGRESRSSSRALPRSDFPFRRVDLRARSRCARHRVVVAGGATRRDVRPPARTGGRPETSPSTPATRTSSASSSTAAAATTRTCSTRRAGARTTPRCRPPPTPFADFTACESPRHPLDAGVWGLVVRARGCRGGRGST